jgi:hypothetical protein
MLPETHVLATVITQKGVRWVEKFSIQLFDTQKIVTVKTRSFEQYISLKDDIDFGIKP